MAKNDEQCVETRLLNARQTARLLGVSERQVWSLNSTGRIPPPIRLNTSVRWRVDDLLRFIDAGCVVQAPSQNRKA